MNNWIKISISQDGAPRPISPMLAGYGLRNENIQVVWWFLFLKTRLWNDIVQWSYESSKLAC